MFCAGEAIFTVKHGGKFAVPTNILSLFVFLTSIKRRFVKWVILDGSERFMYLAVLIKERCFNIQSQKTPWAFCLV